MKRATWPQAAIIFAGYFNPRPREEGDQLQMCCSSEYIYFNPRPREEGDIMETGIKYQNANFNPRPREEGDKTPILIKADQNISIHALVKRATAVVFVPEDYTIFQSTPS